MKKKMHFTLRGTDLAACTLVKLDAEVVEAGTQFKAHTIRHIDERGGCLKCLYTSFVQQVINGNSDAVMYLSMLAAAHYGTSAPDKIELDDFLEYHYDKLDMDGVSGLIAAVLGELLCGGGKRTVH